MEVIYNLLPLATSPHLSKGRLLSLSVASKLLGTQCILQAESREERTTYTVVKAVTWHCSRFQQLLGIVHGSRSYLALFTVPGVTWHCSRFQQLTAFFTNHTKLAICLVVHVLNNLYTVYQHKTELNMDLNKFKLFFLSNFKHLNKCT